MRKYRSISFGILVLVGVVVVTLMWLWTFNSSLHSYRSPLRPTTLVPQSLPEKAQTDKVVVIIISGLGYDNALALNLPVFERLRQTGATAALQSLPPTFSQTAWATLLTGAPADMNDAPLVDEPAEALYVLETDTLLHRAKAAQHQTALFGHANWERILPNDILDHTFTINASGPQADELILETALPFIKDDVTDLIFVQFTQLSFAAKRQGGLASPAYQQAANQIELYLRQISSVIDLSRAVLIITSDHGLTEDGGHGGNEPEVIWQPFVMVGENVTPGSYSDIYQVDLAPTISTLLGTAPPTAAQGRILSEMLRLNEYDQTVLQLGLAKQRAALATVSAAQMADTESPGLIALADDLDFAETTFAQDNVNGALQLALLAREEADDQIAAVRQGQIQKGQLVRLPIALVIVMVWFMIIWRWRGIHAGSIVMATIITIGLYHGLYQLQGNSYSISSFMNISSVPLEIARRTTVSLLVGWGVLLILLLLAGDGNSIRLLGSAYGFSLLVTFIFMLPFFWGYWQNGWGVTSHPPAVVPAFWQITSAFEAMVAAVLGVLLPWPITILCLFIHLVRRRLSETESSRTKTGALPGLHL